MKKDIIIKIPDDLTPEQEAIAIVKKMRQKLLSSVGRNKEQKRIGTEINIIHPETDIKIIRQSKEKPIKFCKCNVCNKDYQSDKAVYAYTNYGGVPRKIATCSPQCVNDLVAFSPDRISASKKSLKPLRFF